MKVLGSCILLPLHASRDWIRSQSGRRITVEVHVLALQIDPATAASVVLLGEIPAPTRVLPIFVGPAEAEAIALTVQGIELPRPMTHDLFVAALDCAGAHVSEVWIVALRSRTFIAELRLQTAAGARTVDARPSDTLALAIRTDAPITVSDDVFSSASVPIDRRSDESFNDEEIEQIVTQFRQILDKATPQDVIDGTDPSE